MIEYLLCVTLFGLGVYCVMSKRNMIKIIVGIVICECAVNTLLVLMAFRLGGRSPIFSAETEIPATSMVDPLPHALVLTSIVIGLATTALMVAIAMRIYEKYGTYDISEVRELRG